MGGGKSVCDAADATTDPVRVRLCFMNDAQEDVEFGERRLER